MAMIFGASSWRASSRDGGRLQLVDLRRQDEIRLGQPVYGVRPRRDLGLTPSEQNVWMMALLFCDLAHSIDESQSGLEVGKLEDANDVMLVDDFPLRRVGQLTMELRQISPLERRHAAAAGNAISTSQCRSAQGETPRRGYPRP